MSVQLDYAEVTGLHLRVGLVDDDGGLEDREDLEDVARDLAGPADACWDVNHTSATTVELSFERALP